MADNVLTYGVMVNGACTVKQGSTRHKDSLHTAVQYRKNVCTSQDSPASESSQLSENKENHMWSEVGTLKKHQSSHMCAQGLLRPILESSVRILTTFAE